MKKNLFIEHEHNFIAYKQAIHGWRKRGIIHIAWACFRNAVWWKKLMPAKNGRLSQRSKKVSG